MGEVVEMAPIQRSEGIIRGSINKEKSVKEAAVRNPWPTEEHGAAGEKRRFQL